MDVESWTHFCLDAIQEDIVAFSLQLPGYSKEIILLAMDFFFQ